MDSWCALGGPACRYSKEAVAYGSPALAIAGNLPRGGFA